MTIVHRVNDLPLSAEQFAALTPYQRGWVVYFCGARDDQPHVPDEENPYPAGSADAGEWNRGQNAAVLAVQDSEE